jgi:hypothetical protein
VQSAAFGGQAYGISGIALVELFYNDKKYYYNIIKDKPLLLRYASSTISIECGTIGTTNAIEFIIPKDDGSKEVVSSQNFYAVWENDKLHSITSALNNPTAKVLRGYSSTSVAGGNQSISFGGGT